MVKIRIPSEHWGRVWRVLVASGPLSRLSNELEYLVSDHQLRVLRQKKLPFQIVAMANGLVTELAAPSSP